MNFKDDVVRMLEKKREAYYKVNDIFSYNAIIDCIREVKRMGCNTCAWCKDHYCTYFMPSEEVRSPYNICGQYEGKE